MTASHAVTAPSLAATQRRIWMLAWPIMLSNITVPLLGLADSAVLAHLPDPQHLGAVAIGAQLFTLLLWSFGFLRMGTTALTSRAAGAELPVQVIQSLQHSLWLVIPVCLLVMAVALIALPWLLPLMGGSDSVQSGAAEYLSIRLLSAPAVLAQYALTGWFIGLGNTRIPLLILTLVNSLNAALDYTFVFHLGMTSDGVALGSVLADYSGLAAALYFARRYGLTSLGARPPLASLRPLLRINRHLFVRTLCLLLVFAFFTAQGARMGELMLAANALLITALLLISSALDGFAHATESLTGHSLGQSDAPLLRRTLILTAANMLLLASLLTLMLWLTGPYLLSLMTNQPELLPQLQRYQHYLFWLPLVGVASYWLDGVFIGAQASAAMRNAMLAAALLVFLPVWWLTREWGNDGLWLAFCAFLIGRALFAVNTFLTLWRHPQNFM
ncbi:MAG: MATE family efflux transporter [Saccharospirillaceae bacterium]|nr:MATE family efflux transporter [Saccharospirillaceae bacterium]MCD8530752.1 MATE family efflux transporter [Saccharospirillaceae bacterium]